MLGAIGRIGSLFNRLPGANALPQVLRGAPTTRGGQLFQGLMSIENASLGLGGLLYGSRQAQDILGRAGFIPHWVGTPLERAKIGDPMILGGKLGYKGADGQWHQRGEMLEGDILNTLPTSPGGTPPPDSTLPPLRDPGSQAGQLTVPPGTLSNGAGDPRQRQNVQQRQISQDVLNAAQQYSAPAGIPLSSFYEGQQQLGRSMMQGGELQRQLRDLGGAAGMGDQPLTDWVKANPGLAYRELLKLKERRSGQ